MLLFLSDLFAQLFLLKVGFFPRLFIISKMFSRPQKPKWTFEDCVIFWDKFDLETSY